MGTRAYKLVTHILCEGLPLCYSSDKPIVLTKHSPTLVFAVDTNQELYYVLEVEVHVCPRRAQGMDATYIAYLLYSAF